MTTSRELVIQAVQCQKTERTPWVPFTGCHAGSLIDATATEYLQSADHIVRGLETAIQRYRPDGIPIVFDLQVEAEILGCQLQWSSENPPSVTSHPLAEGKTLQDLHIPRADEGRIPIALEATRRIREAHPDLALYGLITGPFTLALHLMGTMIFMKMFDNPDELGKTLEFCSRVGQQMAEYYLDNGADIVAIVDPMTSQIGPEQFTQFVTPYLKPIYERIHQKNGLASLFVCGHAQKNIEVMADSGPDNISIDENIALEYVRDICLPRNISFGGNLQLTTVLLLGSELDAKKNAINCLEIGGDRGFILSPGCDLPYATPPANLEAIAAIVHDPYEREVAKTLESHEEVPEVDLDMSDYGSSEKVMIDVITLDSEGCAPCQYMVQAVREVVPLFNGIVEWREHRIKDPKALMIMGAFLVRNIPTICIDGRIAFVSQIPPREKLIEAIQQRINEKLGQRIRSRHRTLYLLADEGDQERQLPLIEQALLETGLDTGDVEIKCYTPEEGCKHLPVAPASFPAIILADCRIKSSGKLVSKELVKEWLRSQ